MRNFWAYVAALVFGPMILFGLCYAMYLIFSVWFGGASCQPTSCQ
jgi:hypothetical protein